MIKRNFTSKDKEIMIPLYKSLVRPRLDFYIQACRPHYQKDIDRLEKVQRRMTKLVNGLIDVPYEERLKRLRLTRFETRMIRADLIEVYKIFHGLDRLEADKFFKMSGLATRGHSYKLFKEGCTKDVGKFKFSNRICDEWNMLREETVSAPSLNTFKAKLDHHLRNTRGFT